MFKLEFSSDRLWLTGMLIIFQAVSLLCKTFVPLNHSIAAQGFFTICLFEHLELSLVYFPKFLAEPDVFPLLKLQYSRFLLFADNHPSQQ
jgi:hypothetical protein